MKPSDKYHIRYFHYLHAINALKFSRNNTVKILDVGCGRGELTQEIATNTGSTVSACDIDKKALKDFSNALRRTGLTIEITVCDVEDLPYKKEAFDIVFMFDVLEHVEHPEKALSEINRILKPRGIYHLVVPCEGDLLTIDGWVQLLFKKNLKEKPIGHIQQFTYQRMNELLSNAGFVTRKIHYSYYLIYQLLSVMYYAYVSFFKRGEYVQITHTKQSNSFVSLLQVAIRLGGWIVYLETFFWNLLFPKFPGQTMHITMEKRGKAFSNPAPKK